MEIMELLDQRLLIVVAFLYVVGIFLKAMPWFKSEWLIPTILWVIGIASAFVYLAFVLTEPLTAATAVLAVIHGTFAAALAVFGNQIIKQWSNRT